MTEQPTATTWVQVTRGGKPGPWHALNEGHRQSWCGSRLTGFNKRHTTNLGDDERRCDACVRALAAGRPRAWRKH